MSSNELATQFINTVDSERLRAETALYISVFQERIEEPAGKSILDMSRAELAHWFGELGIFQISTLSKRVTFLKKYARWCANAGYPVNNELFDFKVADIDTSKAMKKDVFFSVAELRAALDNFPPKDGYYDLPFLYLSWMGVPKKAILELRDEDVDIIGNSIHVTAGGEHYVCVSSLIANDLKEYSKVREATRNKKSEYTVYPDQSGRFIKNMLSAKSNKVGKPIKLAHVEGRYEYLAVSGLLLGEKNVSISNVELSGRFYRIYQAEKELGKFPIVEFNTEFASLRANSLIFMKDTYINYSKVAATL